MEVKVFARPFGRCLRRTCSSLRRGPVSDRSVARRAAHRGHRWPAAVDRDCGARRALDRAVPQGRPRWPVAARGGRGDARRGSARKAQLRAGRPDARRATLRLLKRSAGLPGRRSSQRYSAGSKGSASNNHRFWGHRKFMGRAGAALNCHPRRPPAKRFPGRASMPDAGGARRGVLAPGRLGPRQQPRR